MKDKPRITEEIQHKFGVDKRCISQGLIFYKLRCPRDHFNYEKISAKQYVPKLMEKFKAKPEYVEHVLELYNSIKDHNIFNSNNPQSICKSIVYYYLRRKGCDVSIKTYEKIVELSASVIMRLATQISNILDTLDTVDLGD